VRAAELPTDGVRAFITARLFDQWNLFITRICLGNPSAINITYASQSTETPKSA